MADTPFTAAELGDNISHIQTTTKPRTMSGTFVGDDTDYHVIELDMSVNGGLTYGATNLTDKDMTLTSYGAFESGLDPGDAGAFPIDTTGIVVPAGESLHTTTTDKFPYYLLRCKFAAGPDGSDVTVKACSWEAN